MIYDQNPTITNIDDHINIDIKKTNKTLKDIWDVAFSKIEGESVVCLSGGLDSQFMACLAKEYLHDISALSFVFTWENNIVNTDDVAMSEYIAKHMGIRYEREYVELKNFLDSSLIDYARKYRITSPQIAAHLYALGTSKYRNYNLLMGGDIPMLGVDADGNACVNLSNTQNNAINALSYDFFEHVFLGYYRLASLNDLKIIKGPFTFSDECIYAGYAHNKKIISDHNIISDLSKNNIMKNLIEYKSLYYKSFGYDKIITPFFRRTGFEKLRIYFATLTGNYDEFNDRYRHTLKGLHGDNKIKKVQFDKHIFDDLKKEVQDLIDKRNLRICNRYSFDW